MLNYLIERRKKGKKKYVPSILKNFVKKSKKMKLGRLRLVSMSKESKELENGEGRRQNFVIPAKFYTGFSS